MVTLEGAIEKSPILLSQYWKNEGLDDTIIISYLVGSNNIFADCNYRLFQFLDIKSCALNLFVFFVLDFPWLFLYCTS